MRGDDPQRSEAVADAEALASAAQQAAAGACDWTAALAALARAEELVDDAVHAAVAEARAAGWTLAHVGRDLGVTQQAASKRFSGRARQRLRGRAAEDREPLDKHDDEQEGTP